jgi:hypothetical protein
MAEGDQMLGDDKQAMKREAAKRFHARKRTNNTNKATVIGGASGVGGSVVVAWLSAEGERRYGVPLPVTAAVLGAAFAFVARWAAKLLPDET